jgi:uncharacterized protein (TIGR03437 family)
VNAASGFAGPVAAGEIISIQGSGLGPATSVPMDIRDGLVQSVLGDVQVIFDNIAAPLMSVSANAITTIVPYEMVGRTSIRMVVMYKGVASAPVQLNVADSAPGIYFADSTGQAAALNEDGSPNSPANPVQRGHTLLIYGTGEGSTDPFGTNGLVNPADGSQPKAPTLPVKVTIGGSAATIVSAGSVPGKVSGAFQVSVIVPDDAPTGDTVWTLLTVGGVDSPAAYVAIQ